MDLRQLQFLCALDRARHFGEAARQCHVTQPTLSMRLRALEEELGFPLVQRGHRFEGFTPEGEHILHWAHKITAAQAALKAEAAAFKGQLVGRARLGQVPFTTVDPMPIFAGIHQRYPQLTFSITINNNQTLLDALSENILDAAIVYAEGIHAQRYHFQRIHRSDFELLYSPQEFPNLRDRDSLDWRQIVEFPLGMLTSTHRFRKDLNTRLHELDIELDPLLEADSIAAIIAAVNQGICCAVIPSGFSSNVTGLERLSLCSDKPTQANLPDLGVAIKRQSPISPISKLLFDALSTNHIESRNQE